jgi:hypothetical protein
VVLEECQPALHLRLVGLALQRLQIARHGGFRNLKSEAQQFAWMRGAPQDEFSDFMRRINR